MTLEVHRPTVDGSTIECEVTPSRQVRRFFTGEPFRVEYDVDVAGLPPALASIPALAHVCPVAWANGEDVRVPTADATYLQALEVVRDALCRMYPSFMDGGEIHVANAVDTRTSTSSSEFEDSGLLFTGGIDSIASYVRHREEDPTLVSVQGWVVDVEQDDRWAGVVDHIDAFATEHDLSVQTVRSNMLSCLDTPMLQSHYQRYVDGAWYSSVGHGLGLLSLCAPLAYHCGLGTVHMAASHTAEFDQPWGSHPDIDDNVRWTYTEGHHDGYDLSRQEKIELIADYVGADGAAFPVRTCTRDNGGGNCNHCEKCYRTMCGMVLAGLDPNRFGYEMDEGTFAEIRAALEGQAFVMDDHTVFHWLDIQRHVHVDRSFPIDGATEFFQWLQTADIEALAESASPPASQRVLQAVARRTPYPIYNLLYPAYGAVKKRVL